MAIKFTSTRTTILDLMAFAASRIGDIDASGLEGLEARRDAAGLLSMSFQIMIEKILKAAGHAEHVSGVSDCLTDMAGDHFHCLTEDLVDARMDQYPIDPHAEHRLSARQLGVGRAA